MWYYFVAVAFVGAGLYKVIAQDIMPGVTWIVIGILFGLLARTKK